MPINIRKTSNQRSLERIAKALVDQWLRLRIRWRHNPGFVAAAAAGSIGLALALGLAVQGGLRLLDETPASDELADESLDPLFAGAGMDVEGAGDELGDPFSERGPRARRVARESDDDDLDAAEQFVRLAPAERVEKESAARKHLLDEESIDTSRVGRDRRWARFDNEPEESSERIADEFRGAESKAKKLLAQSGQSQGRIRQDDSGRGDTETESDADADAGAGADAETDLEKARHPLDEHPLADETETPRRFPRHSFEAESVDGHDDVLASERLDENSVQTNQDPPAGKPLDQRPAGLKLDLGSVFDNEAREESENENDDGADRVRRAAAEKGAPSRWRHLPSTSKAAPNLPPALARKSRASETLVVATPGAGGGSSARANSPLRGDGLCPRLKLEIAGPQSAKTGQACAFEIRVSNVGTTTERNLTLSVDLPVGLVHDVGPSLEQQIATLAPGAIYRGVVRVRATMPGPMTLKTDVAAQGAVASRLTATFDIAGASGAPANATRLSEECLPLAR